MKEYGRARGVYRVVSINGHRYMIPIRNAYVSGTHTPPQYRVYFALRSYSFSGLTITNASNV